MSLKLGRLFSAPSWRRLVAVLFLAVLADAATASDMIEPQGMGAVVSAVYGVVERLPPGWGPPFLDLLGSKEGILKPDILRRAWGTYPVVGQRSAEDKLRELQVKFPNFDPTQTPQVHNSTHVQEVQARHPTRQDVERVIRTLPSSARLLMNLDTLSYLISHLPADHPALEALDQACVVVARARAPGLLSELSKIRAQLENEGGSGVASSPALFFRRQEIAGQNRNLLAINPDLINGVLDEEAASLARIRNGVFRRIHGSEMTPEEEQRDEEEFRLEARAAGSQNQLIDTALTDIRERISALPAMAVVAEDDLSRRGRRSLRSLDARLDEIETREALLLAGHRPFFKWLRSLPGELGAHSKRENTAILEEAHDRLDAVLNLPRHDFGPHRVVLLDENWQPAPPAQIELIGAALSALAALWPDGFRELGHGTIGWRLLPLESYRGVLGTAGMATDRFLHHLYQPPYAESSMQYLANLVDIMAEGYFMAFFRSAYLMTDPHAQFTIQGHDDPVQPYGWMGAAYCTLQQLEFWTHLISLPGHPVDRLKAYEVNSILNLGRMLFAVSVLREFPKTIFTPYGQKFLDYISNFSEYHAAYWTGYKQERGHDGR